MAALPGFTIPNDQTASAREQEELHELDLQILAAAAGRTGVVRGCAVSAQGTPDMTLAVAVGQVMVDGLVAPVTAGNVTITAANGTNPRYDLVVVDKAGAKSATAGTAGANPVKPDLPADRACLAEVWVPANDTAIGATQIVDKRVLLGFGRSRIQTGQGYYYVLPSQATSTVGTGLNTLTACPIWLPAGITLDRICLEVTTGGSAGAVWRLGIYYDSGYGYPGPLLLDAGTFDATSTGQKEITISQAITEDGLYWLAGVPQVATSTVRAYTGLHPSAQLLAKTAASGNEAVLGAFYNQTNSVSGALTSRDPFISAGIPLTNQNMPRIQIRVT